MSEMLTLYTAATAADRLATLGRHHDDGTPISPAAVRYLARRHEIGRKMGRVWVFTETDLVQMAGLPRVGHPVA